MQDTSAALLTGVRDLLLHLDPTTTAILRASPSSTALIGAAPADLHGQPLAALIHPDDFPVFISEMHDAATARSSSSSSIAFRFHVRISNTSGYAAFELHGSLQHAGGYLVLTARPLLLKHTAAFDSFLDLKTEQLMLLRQIRELREEALAEAAAAASASPIPPSPATTTGSSPYPAVGAAVAREVKGDLGIFFVPREHADAPVKRRGKRKTTDDDGRPIGERCCQWCGATSAPEWRRGPGGPKTLCNACGRPDEPPTSHHHHHHHRRRRQQIR
ncbi:Gata transcription factor [Lasiodiplodia theobromae]|uniref:Gata transcription factor n=1 Tax=Lasiodiplodia theobromae TaxID=45133 RepID=UPI0015C37B60|nr:Gata transcription factor [Lasiodiplodia theobromae]KAF4546169.1 Gata transcription factor [Lasiodiplodia theobromae]